MFARSLRAPLRVLLRQRNVREGALRRARNPAQNPVRNPAYLLRLSGVLRLRALRLRALRLLRVRILPARLLACPPPLI